MRTAGSGSTSSTAPSLIASLGMPKTTQLASSWARCAAPVAHLLQAARAVVAHAGHDDAERRCGRRSRATERNSTSTLGPVAVDRRPVLHLDA
jgi:hypothetical protein